MKYTYPIVITYEKDSSGVDYLVSIPDFDIMTQGTTLVNAIEMGQDLLSLTVVDFEDAKKDLPKATELSALQNSNPSDIVTLVVADSSEYRKIIGNKAVKKTLTIPGWLNARAEAQGVNFSKVLQEALREKLG